MGIAIPRPAMRRREEQNITDTLKLHNLLTIRKQFSGLSVEDASREALIELKTLTKAQRKRMLASADH